VLSIIQVVGHQPLARTWLSFCRQARLPALYTIPHLVTKRFLLIVKVTHFVPVWLSWNIHFTCLMTYQTEIILDF